MQVRVTTGSWRGWGARSFTLRLASEVGYCAAMSFCVQCAASLQRTAYSSANHPHAGRERIEAWELDAAWPEIGPESRRVTSRYSSSVLVYFGRALAESLLAAARWAKIYGKQGSKYLLAGVHEVSC